MASKEKPGFVLYHDDMANLEPLTDEECGKLIRAASKYSQTGEIEQFDGVLAFALHMLIRKIDRDDQKYAETCRKRGKRKESEDKQDKNDMSIYDDISDINEDMATYVDISNDKRTKYKDKYKPPLKGIKKDNISHNARARADEYDHFADELNNALETVSNEDAERLTEEGLIVSDCCIALNNAGNDDPSLFHELLRLADRYTAQNVKRAALKAIRDGTPTIKDIRGILFSWAQNDMHRDQVIRIQELQKQEEQYAHISSV